MPDVDLVNRHPALQSMCSKDWIVRYPDLLWSSGFFRFQSLHGMSGKWSIDSLRGFSRRPVL